MELFHSIVGQILDGVTFVRAELLDVLGPSGPTVVFVGQIMLTGGLLASFFAGKTLWAPPTPALKDFGPRLVAAIVGFCVIALMIWLAQDPTAPALRLASQLIVLGVVSAFVYLFAFSTRTFVCEFDPTRHVKGLWLRREARHRMRGQKTGIAQYDRADVPRNTALYFCDTKRDPEFVWTTSSQTAAQVLLLFIYLVFMGSFVLSLACVAMAFQHRDVTETTTTVELNLSADVLFDFDKWVLRPDATDTLQLAARRLRDGKITAARVQGHTDAIGTPDYNAKLSLARAEAVRNWLRATGGLGTVEFKLEAFGATKPVAPNETEDGRKLNRRVTVVIDR